MYKWRDKNCTDVQNMWDLGKTGASLQDFAA
jgi:hypothetical protein